MVTPAYFINCRKWDLVQVHHSLCRNKLVNVQGTMLCMVFVALLTSYNDYMYNVMYSVHLIVLVCCKFLFYRQQICSWTCDTNCFSVSFVNWVYVGSFLQTDIYIYRQDIFTLIETCKRGFHRFGWEWYHYRGINLLQIWHINIIWDIGLVQWSSAKYFVL